MKPNDVVSNLPNNPTPNTHASVDSAQQEQQAGLDFVRQVITDDLAAGRAKQIVTRFPPEPNGYLHIGHVKAICLNFGVAEEFNGLCNLRFDDTNPDAEEQEYVDGIANDVKWLGFSWNGEPRYASGYFDQLYAWAIQLIEQGDAYVDLQSPEEIKLNRGSFVEPGKNSPYRDASVEENLARFEKMRNGELKEGKLFYAPKLIWQARMYICVTQFCIVFYIQSITKQAISGKSTQCMTMLIHCLMRSKESHIHFVH